jgi:hypothetical protein
MLFLHIETTAAQAPPIQDVIQKGVETGPPSTSSLFMGFVSSKKTITNREGTRLPAILWII